MLEKSFTLLLSPRPKANLLNSKHARQTEQGDTRAKRDKSTAAFRTCLHIQNAFVFQIKRDWTYYLAIHTARKLKM